LFVIKKIERPRDPNSLLSFALVLLAILPELFSSPLRSAPDVCDEQVLGTILLFLYLALAGKFIPLS
jgi:hypothetical protein